MKSTNDRSGYWSYLVWFSLKFMAARGYNSTKCPKPCSRLLVKSELTYQRQTKDNLDGRMFLYFERDLKVTRHIVEYTWFNLIVDVGSSLGLWIGLSILGIYDLALDMLVKFSGKNV